MTRIRTRLKQRFCTHYHKRLINGMPLFDLFPKRRILYGRIVREAKNDIESVKCLNCELKYFVTDIDGTLLY